MVKIEFAYRIETSAEPFAALNAESVYAKASIYTVRCLSEEEYRQVHNGFMKKCASQIVDAEYLIPISMDEYIAAVSD